VRPETNNFFCLALSKKTWRIFLVYKIYTKKLKKKNHIPPTLANQMTAWETLMKVIVISTEKLRFKIVKNYFQII
jgi:hypothetical protein